MMAEINEHSPSPAPTEKTDLEVPADDASSRTGTVTPTKENEDEKEKPWKPHWTIYVIFATMMVITLTAALDATSLSVALPIMARKLKGSAIEAFWAGTSFLLTSTVFQPAFASFSVIFGRKPMILIGLVFFTVGAIVCAVANDFTVLLVGRSIQGIGGGAIIALTEILITDLVPLRERGKWFGFISMMWALGSVTGPIVGGAFAQEASWRWIFWINLFFTPIGFVAVPLFLKLHTRVGSFADKLKQVDWVGTVVFVASTTSVLIPISWGGVMYDWDHWRTLVPLILGFVGLVAFVFWEIYVAEDPMIRMRVFTNRTAAANYFGTVLHGIVLWSMLYYGPLYYQAIKDMSPILSGVALFPQTFTVAPASIVVGIVVSITGKYRWAIWAGWVLTTVGMGIMSLLDVGTTTVAWIFINLVAGLGTGMLFPSMAFAIQASASSEDTAYAVALFSFFRAFGQSFGVAIGGVIFQNTLTSKLTSTALSEQAAMYAKDAVGLVEVINDMKDPVLRSTLKHAYAESLQVVWLAMMGFSAAALIASAFTKELSLDRELESEQMMKAERKRTLEAEKGGA